MYLNDGECISLKHLLNLDRWKYFWKIGLSESLFDTSVMMEAGSVVVVVSGSLEGAVGAASDDASAGEPQSLGCIVSSLGCAFPTIVY